MAGQHKHKTDHSRAAGKTAARGNKSRPKRNGRSSASAADVFEAEQDTLRGHFDEDAEKSFEYDGTNSKFQDEEIDSDDVWPNDFHFPTVSTTLFEIKHGLFYLKRPLIRKMKPSMAIYFRIRPANLLSRKHAQSPPKIC